MLVRRERYKCPEELQMPGQDGSITGGYHGGHRCASASYLLRGANRAIFRRLVFDLAIELSAE